jgi:hypothetical protein
LQKVFRLNRHPSVVIWTNRFPVEYLEGLEDLIQDPHKMLDEVNGRRFQVRRYLDEGVPLECRDKERCQYCFIEPFCNTADRVVERQNTASWDVWWIGAAEEAEWAPQAGLIPGDLPYGSAYLGFEVDDLTDLERLPVHPGIGIYVKPKTIERLVDRTAVPNPLLVNVREAEHLDALLSAGDIPAGVDLEIELNQRTAPWLLSHRDRVEANSTRLRLHQPSYEFLKDATANDVRNPKEFFAALGLPVRASGLPACSTPHARLAEAAKILRREMFDPESGRVATRELARTHVVEGYWGKSLRCRDCRVNARCDGAHINFLRDQGFRQLEPLRDGPWADDAEAQMLRLRPEPPKRLRDGKPLEPVARSLPGFAPPEKAPTDQLIVETQRAREAREQRRQALLLQKEEAPPPA